MEVREILTHFSLFTGIGGIDLSAEWAGFETVGQCEWADYPIKVLEKNWPDVPRWRDIRDVTISSIRSRGIQTITLLSGGFPCQPHSVAGERKASADERDLWGEFRRLICEIKPRWVLGENVPGLLTSEDGRFFGRVLNDLATMGYSVGWCCFPAYTVGAVFSRARIFIVASADCNRLQGVIQRPQKTYETYTIQRPPSENIRTALSVWSGEIPDTDRVRNDYGISSWMDRIKCLGNAVVPQQVYPILKAIADIERYTNEL